MEELKYDKYIIDCESNGLLDTATKVHSLGWCKTSDGNVCSTTHYDQMRDLLTRTDIIVIGHNFKLFDQVLLEKLLNIKITCPVWDTLGISWILENSRDKHSLQSYQEEFGLKKVEITDWEGLSAHEYCLRVEEDVKINHKLWVKQAKQLNQLYEGNHNEIHRFLNYISQKLDVVREHQELGIKLDIELCQKSLIELEAIKEEKMVQLREAMPKKANKSTKFPPKIMYKANGEPSANRLKWLEFLKEQGKPEDWNQEVEYIHSYDEPNPGSSVQIKMWLDSLHWSPQNFKYVREEGQREMRKIPQIKAKNSEEGEICESIVKLMDKEPSLEALESLSILSHRIGLFKGFLQNQRNGRLYQGIHAYTNTMRLTHSILVNLPMPNKKYAGNIRKCLVAGEGNILFGTDLVSIENKIRDSYIYPYDPNYVNEMQGDFESHTDIAKLAGLMDEEEEKFYKWYSRKG